jgi:RNA polymerase sigma factor (sigma-70 family)
MVIRPPGRIGFPDRSIPEPLRNVPSPVAEASDDTLLAGLATGDADNAAAFIRRFQRRVYGLAVSIVGEPGAAEDVAQEAFLRAWRHAAAYDARRGSVTTWLLTITRNLALDHLRVRRADATDPAALVAMALPGRDVDPGDRAGTSDEVARAVGVVRGLPDEQRRALVLAALLGWTAREIAESEAIPIGTAKTRIRSGLGKLRASLVEERE